MKMLLVDDDRFSGEFLAYLLKDYGTRIVVGGGEKAIELFRAALESGEPFDLVCLDMMMPRISGLEVLTHLRELEAALGPTADLVFRSKVIMTTCVNTPREVVESFKRGCDAYVTKPYDCDQLYYELKVLGLDAREGEEEAPARE
jgi:two-component system chemotaxis response regulator CheY